MFGDTGKKSKEPCGKQTSALKFMLDFSRSSISLFEDLIFGSGTEAIGFVVTFASYFA